jgi:hypothetical protein
MNDTPTDPLIREILALRELPVSALRERYLAVFGEESTSRNKDYAERADMRSRQATARVLRSKRPRSTPHIAHAFGGRMILRFLGPEACMATGAASWRSEGERA